jgi:general secretion pathway protein D
VLEVYGVGIIIAGEVLRFVPMAASGGEVPLLISGETLPEVPTSHRTVFRVVPLRVLSNNQTKAMLGSIFTSPQLAVTESIERNALILQGPPHLVQRAAEIIGFIDQPYMRSRHSLRIEPVFVEVEEFARQLLEVLKAEGYAVGMGSQGVAQSIFLLPFKTSNSVVAFANDRKALEHIRQWASKLDQPKRLTGDKAQQARLFFYPVQNTQAKELAGIISPLLNTVTQAPQAAPATAVPLGQPPQNPVAPAQPQQAGGGSNKLVVDPIRNALLFQGTPDEWARLLPILKEIDKPAKLVLVEVTIAEITLTNQENFGIEWQVSGVNMGIGDYNGILGTLGGLGIGSAGLNYTLVNSLGQTRAMLNALASNSRVRVLSSPRVMVKSGESANIRVGDEVPVITSQSVDPSGVQEGNSALLQQIQYRSTGINLSVKPVAHAGSRVDLEITQEVSNAIENKLSDISSPVILNRSIDTKISLSDGGSVLLGGLIRQSVDSGMSGVPILSDIPLIGHLFRVDRMTNERAELIVLIVPYIVNNDQEAADITEAFKQSLQIMRPESIEALPEPVPEVVPEAAPASH